MGCRRAQRRMRVSGHEPLWDSRPCTALLLPATEFLPGGGGAQGHVLHWLCLLQLLPPPMRSSARPGTSLFPCVLGGHSHLQPDMTQVPNPLTFPSTCPRTGQMFCRLGVPVPAAPTHTTASQITPTCSPSPNQILRAAPGAVLGTSFPLPPQAAARAVSFI